MFKAKAIYQEILVSIDFNKEVGEKHKELIKQANVQAGSLVDYCESLIKNENCGGSLEIAAIMVGKFHEAGIRAFIGVVTDGENERYVVVFKINNGSYVADIEKEFDPAVCTRTYGLKYEEFVAENPSLKVFKNLFGNSCNDVFFGEFYSKVNKGYEV